MNKSKIVHKNVWIISDNSNSYRGFGIFWTQIQLVTLKQTQVEY